MTKWPYCHIHNEPLVLMFVAGQPHYVCQQCHEEPLMYDTKTIQKTPVTGEIVYQNSTSENP